MNANSSQAAVQAVPQHLPKPKPKSGFIRSVLALLVSLAIAAFIFWLFNIRQPGVSYQRTGEPDPVNTQTPVIPQTPVDSTPAAGNQATDAIEKPLTTEQVLKKHVVHLATTIGERNLLSLIHI